MEIEQIMSLLQVCGFVLILPATICMVGAVFTVVRWRSGNEAPEISTFPERQKPEQDAAAPAAEGQERSRQRRRMRKPGQAAEANPESVHQPTVTVSIPPEAAQKLLELWYRFPEIPADWNILYRQEETE